MTGLDHFDQFQNRHIGPNTAETAAMLQTIGVRSLDQLIDETVPAAIRAKKPLNLPEPLGEHAYLTMLKGIAAQNSVFKNFIGQGYFGTLTPTVILRNLFENPGWYTQYTPYQAEIAQGRLESLLNFQTLVSDMTGLPIANASLLDEATAAAEAMTMFFHEKNKRSKSAADNADEFFVSKNIYPQTLDVLLTRAKPLGIRVVSGDWKTYEFTTKSFGVLLQYPDNQGLVEDYRAFVEKAKAKNAFVAVASDLLALALLKPPGEWGADVCVGNSQRFGVPMGFGGPHAAFFAVTDDFKRQIPGRIIGVSTDSQGKPALRMALQTREQHIRREKATSNICTAQALLSNMAAMYAVYHGPAGIKSIARRTHLMAQNLEQGLRDLGYSLKNAHFFDTIRLEVSENEQKAIRASAEKAGMNFYYSGKNNIQIALDEATTKEDVEAIQNIFAQHHKTLMRVMIKWNDQYSTKVPAILVRETAFLTHPVFNSHHTESEMMRYLKRLENKDLSLVHSMISLGSCTMKLNAATEMIPVSWPEFGGLHPFAPAKQTKGYALIINELEQYLSEITGFAACSLQPNSGAQGEYAGLLVIKALHENNRQGHRNIALIPSSAHGTNPASAVMVGLEVVVVGCDERGNIDMADLKAKAEQYSKNLAALMVTYPSTHGVFETSIKEICEIIHQNGGRVYMDGANMNAQVGLTSPGLIGADVCHLNLHKTFAIPHGGGGPGMGPICCTAELAPFLSGHVTTKMGGKKATHAVSAAPWGSASILLISYAYIRMLGAKGVTDATKYAILNANYMKVRLEKAFPILYVGENGRAAHEMILDLRGMKQFVSAEDVAKRLMDYGFHAPTLSFPVAGTIMIEPTESENKAELDRFCDALLEIRKEIDEIAAGMFDPENNLLHNAPHTIDMISGDEWLKPYGRERAAFPLPYLREGYKFWPTIGRIDQAKGDRNLICVCPPIEAYQTV
jgi:glycine dehydrogenase